MPFPRAKANGYEYGVHVPLAIRFPKSIPAGVNVKQPVDFVDLAPTMLDAAGIIPHNCDERRKPVPTDAG